ncbi:MAG TPA: arylsulfatase [Propionibacteriaceae bacterium]
MSTASVDAGPAYADFAGRVGRTISQSVPAWPEPVRPPAGTPNIVVVLVDDLGYADIGPYGSEIPTPNLDRLAASGVACTNYHTTPLCSPSRAALLTGVNPHKVGFAYPANSDPGYPAYTFELPEHVPTLAESLRDAGYATFMVGKWHLTGDRSLNDGADKSSWPVQRGFDRYFGSLEGFTSLHAPHRLVWDNSPYPVQDYPDDYYLTDELTERATEMIRSLRASDETKPFLLYFAHHAVHGPVQATAEDIDLHDGVYEAGWDEIRQRRFDRQRELGLFPESTVLPEPETEPTHQVPPWSSLPFEEQERFARYMQAYAGAVSAVDRSLGRLVDVLTEHGELDNTVIVFTSDNGGTAEGGLNGTRSYFSQFAHVAGLPADWDRDVDRPLELIGGPQSAVHYPRGWGQASNTPFRLYKGHAYAGGIRAPLIVSWPGGDLADGGLRHQYLHVTDLTPTLLDLAGVAPAQQRHGLAAEPFDGATAADVLRKAEAPSGHGPQYTETGGQRAYQTDEWKIVTDHRFGAAFDDTEWRLYDLAADPTETRDLAREYPDRTAELAAAWERAAWENRVFPLDDHGPASSLRRPDDDHFGAPVTLFPGTPTLERFRSAQLISHRDFRIRIGVRIRPGDEGVLVAHGDQGGGYQVRIETAADGEPAATVVVNAYGAVHRSQAFELALGENTLTLDVSARPGFRWDLRLSDGIGASTLTDLPQLLGMAPFTGISVGADAGGPVDWSLHSQHGSFAYTGLLHHVRYEPGPLSADAPAERARIWAEGAKIYD